MATSIVSSGKSVWGFSPQSIPGLALWLDGGDKSSMVLSGTTVTTWNDKSGNGLNATATGTPTYTSNALNGLGAPALNSNANYFSTPSFTPSPTTGTPSIFMVMNQTSYSGAGNSDFFSASNWQVIDLIGQGGAFNAALTIGGSSQTPINATTTHNNPTLLSIVVSSASGGVGYANGTYTASTGSAGGSLAGSYVYYVGGGPGFIGFVYELIIFNNTLSTSQRQQVEGYLASKWGLHNQLPNAHPYSSVVPILPTQIPGCVLWLDGADTTSMTFSSGYNVSSWNDKSGNGYNATKGTNAPTVLTGGGISFDGTQLFSLSATYSQTASTFFLVGKANTSTGQQYFFNFDSTNNGISIIGNGEASGYIDLYGNPTVWGRLSTSGSTNAFIVSESHVSAGNYIGVLNGTQIVNAAFTAGAATKIVCLGSPFNNGTSGGQVTIYEFILFNSFLSTPQRQLIEQYLGKKWGISVANAPSPGPYLIPYNRPFRPVDIPGCSLWLDAGDQSSMTFSSGSNVSIWKDKSGTGNNATTANGTPALTTTGTTQFIRFPNITRMLLTTTLATIPSVFVVAKTDTITNGSVIIGVPVVTSGIASYYFQIVTNGSPFDQRYSVASSTTAGSSALGSFPGTNTLCIMTGLFDPTNAVSGLVLRTNGTSKTVVGGVTQTTVANTFIGNMDWYAGSFGNPGGTIDICEIVEYNSLLSTSQVQQVEQYLAQKWGLVANLPTGHPGKLMPAFSTNFTPKSVTGMQLWLDAGDRSSMNLSGTSVTQWNDKSGNGNNGTPTTYFGGSATTIPLIQNSIGSLPSLQFTGGSSILGNIVLTGTGYTAFCIFNVPTQPTTAQNPRIFTLTRPGVSDGNGGDVGGMSINGNINKLGFVRFNGSVSSYATVSIPYNTAILSSAWSDSNFAYMSTYGSITPVVSSPSVSLGSLNTTVYAVGSQITNDVSSPLTGFIGELLIFNNTLTTSQRQQVEGYLAWKWGLQSSLPSTHAYAKFSP